MQVMKKGIVLMKFEKKKVGRKDISRKWRKKWITGVHILLLLPLNYVSVCGCLLRKRERKREQNYKKDM